MNYRDDVDGNLVWPSREGLHNGRGSDSSETERGYRSTSRSEQSAFLNRNGMGMNGHHDLGDGSPEPIPNLPYWSAKRHLTCGNPTPPPPWAPKMPSWRSTAGKLKTHNAALVLCLNIDVDPPDVVKTNPCATLECWVDPHTMPSYKALDIIGTNLRHQFEGLSPKILYKAFLDPSDSELREGCIKARTSAKTDAVLFHYNGHGVPKPTPSGELWCFNKNYTQYIPLSLQEIQRCLGTPCVYIWDCSAAGHLLNNFLTFAKRLDEDPELSGGNYPDPPYANSIQLAACLADENLPTCPELPADLFTSCLTSPIDIALRHFIMNNQLPTNISADMVMQLPGDLKDRRTPLGELNWIFTAITDTIAWTSFPSAVFTRLYRSDLLVASLFRNFLLAERIMKNYHCTPHTSPPLPATNTHPLWASWDLAVDACLRQLPVLLKNTEPIPPGSIPPSLTTGRRRNPTTANSTPNPNDPSAEQKSLYIPSRFFSDQLTAFEVWISRGGSALTKRGPLSLPLTPDQCPPPDILNGSAEPQSQESSDPSKGLVPRKPPDQLPIVLQVLLSQPHRLRALILLSQFVDLGPWAVHLALTIGIFPYISRLLQAAGQDLRPVLIFIWARILAVDPSCQADLHTGQGYRYFANILSTPDDPRQAMIPNSSEHKAMCAFILSVVARDYPLGQRACWAEHVFDACYLRLDEGDYLLRQWSALCIAQIWDAYDEIRVWGVDKGTQDRLIALTSDDSAEVRAAALYAVGTFMGASGSADQTKLGGGGTGPMPQLEERIHFRMEIAVVTGVALSTKEDASPMVRKELLVVISCLVKEWRGYFIICAWIYWEEERRRLNPRGSDEDVTGQAVDEWLVGFDNSLHQEEHRVWLSSFFTIFCVILELSGDPYQEVAASAQTIIDYIIALLLESPFTRLENTSLDKPPPYSLELNAKRHLRSRVPSGGSLHPTDMPPASPLAARPGLNRSDSMTSTMTNTISSGVTSTLRRTSSFANALRNLAGGIAFPSAEDGRASPQPRVQDHNHLQVPGVSRPPSPNLNYAQYTSPYSRPSTPPNDNLSVRTPPSPDPSQEAARLYIASDILEALVEEDMERLRARRRAGTKSHKHHGHHGVPMSSPSGSTFSVESGTSVILGLGTGIGIRDVLPLKSRFYDWCCEYFKEPQMRQPEPDEPGSVDYNYQVWRQQRNENIINNTRAQADVAESCRWDRPVATLQVAAFPAQLAFHAFDPHLAVTNESDSIIVYDWMHRKKLSQFFNGNPKGSSITSLYFINEDVGGLILTGAADGVARLYRNYDPDLSGGPVQMVSAFRALSETVPLKRGAGMVLNWKQNGGIVLASGDSRIVRVWDAHTEAPVIDIETKADSPVTSMVSEEGTSMVFLASFGDGVVRLYDRRLEEDDAVVRTYNAHASWAQGVRWHPSVPSQFATASADGEVKLFDVRGASDRPLHLWDVHPQGLSAFDVHQLTGVFAATSTVTATNWRTQRAAVHSLTTSNALSTLSSVLTVPPPRDPLSPFINRSSSLVFHPREMVYAVGSLDGSVRVLGCKFPS